MTERQKRFLRRSVRHVAFAVIGTLIIGLVANIADTANPIARMSLGAAYAGTFFFAATLLVGPYYVWRGRALPVSSTLRRDLGIWAAVHALMHTGIGFDVYYSGAFWRYFVWPPGESGVLPLRTDIFGWANVTGLAVALIVVMLLALSNNVMLRRLTPERWKRLQRWAYAGAGLTLVHGWLYQIYEGRTLAFVALLIAVALITLGFQLWGAGTRARRPTTTSP